MLHYSIVYHINHIISAASPSPEPMYIWGFGYDLMYIYIYISLSVSLSLYMYMYIYIYIYIWYDIIWEFDYDFTNYITIITTITTIITLITVLLQLLSSLLLLLLLDYYHSRGAWMLLEPGALRSLLSFPSTDCSAVGFHNFNLRIFNLRVSSPNKLMVDVFLTRCRISMCQGLGPKKHDEISEIDRGI